MYLFRVTFCYSFGQLVIEKESWAIVTVNQSGVRMLDKSRNAQYLNTSELPRS